MAPHRRWTRALLAIDRTVRRAHQLEATVRDELLWAWVPADRRGDMTREIYAGDRSYAPGGSRYDHGLFEWEARVLARDDLPRRGRVLVGGAGGGREMRELVARGFSVTGFEPCEVLARDAEALALGTVLRGAHQDLAAAAVGSGPLAPLADDAPYALVVLGWRSLSHVLEEEERVAIFRSVRRLAPSAPVIASFLPVGAGHPMARAQHYLRRIFGRLGAPTPPPGAAFVPAAGFAVALGRADVERCARAGDYALALCETEGEGVALFLPRT